MKKSKYTEIVEFVERWVDTFYSINNGQSREIRSLWVSTSALWIVVGILSSVVMYLVMK